VSAERPTEPTTAQTGDAVRFTETLAAHIEARRADGRNLALLLIDCSVVGRIDDVWGYDIGDAIRGRIVTALRTNVLRPGDVVEDIGRDDFACILSPVEGSAVAMLAAEKSLRVLNSSFWIGEEEIFARPAIGIAICPTHGEIAPTLLQRAKSACAVARERPTRIAEYVEDQENPAATRLLYENRLRTAITEDAVDLAFQPQYDLRFGQMMGIESLLRWRDAARGIIPAEHAFAAAESGGILTNLLSSVLNRALRNVSEFRYSAGLDLRVCVNLPGRALLNPEVPDVIQRALGTWSLRPGRLIVEIGETSILHTETQARETLARLKELGVKLSIDDPNLALSSLFQLATMPFQELKIDVSSAGAFAATPKAERILQSIVELAHQLRLDIVAFNVADEAGAAKLKELGYDYMQGDYRGAAVDPKSFVERFGSNEE